MQFWFNGGLEIRNVFRLPAHKITIRIRFSMPLHHILQMKTTKCEKPPPTTFVLYCGWSGRPSFTFPLKLATEIFNQTLFLWKRSGTKRIVSIKKTSFIPRWEKKRQLLLAYFKGMKYMEPLSGFLFMGRFWAKGKDRQGRSALCHRLSVRNQKSKLRSSKLQHFSEERVRSARRTVAGYEGTKSYTTEENAALEKQIVLNRLILQYRNTGNSPQRGHKCWTWRM